MSTVSNNSIARAIYAVSKDKSDSEQAVIFGKVAQFLARKRLLSKSGDILAHLDKIINEAEGKVAVKIYSAENLSENDKKKLTHSLSARYSGKSIVLEEHIDKKLLGGLRLEIDDEVIDLSLKNRLARLEANLIKV
jgi:F-type H+-transporting ATPase subunit delta